ncbi:MAG: c-type cytochrome domain-containing protein [Myxococcota bacterium]
MSGRLGGSRAALAAAGPALVSAALAAVWAVGAAGCLDALEPDVGALVREPCIDEDSDPDSEVRFSADILEPIFGPDGLNCVNCHTQDGANPIGVQVGGLDLSNYATLRAGGTVSGSLVITPGQPCTSILIQKVSSGPPFGARMPLNGPPFVSAEQRQVISDWIAEGARDN